MKTPHSIWRPLSAVLLGLALAAAACDPATAPSAEPSAAPAATPATIDEAPETLSLRVGAASGERVPVDLVYRRRADQAAPRMMELHVRYGAGLEYVGSATLDAAQQAQKDLVVQDPGGELRIVLYAATNMALLESGPLARLTFRLTGGPDTSLTLLPRFPIFAPATANEGLLLGPSLQIAPPRAAGATP